MEIICDLVWLELTYPVSWITFKVVLCYALNELIDAM